MSRPTAIVAEDEAHLADELCDMLAELWPELVVTTKAANGAEAVAALDRAVPDVLFLDIQMPGLSGIEVARRASGRCHVVFVTAYDHYAIEAFEHDATDYLLKPVTTERLARTVDRLKSRFRAPVADIAALVARLAERLAPQRQYLRWITIPEGEEMRLVTMDEICYFQSDSKYTRVVTNDRSSLVRRTIKELAEEVDPDVFWQIHRGTLVNVNAVAGLVRDMAGHLRVKLKQRRETLPVSEPYAHRFRGL